MFVPLQIPIEAIASVPFIVYVFYLAVVAQRKKPKFEQADVVYEESSASGFSEANLLMKFGGSLDNVRLIVTREHLIVTTWLLFVGFSASYDMEHVIPLHDLEPIESKKRLFKKYLRLRYRDNESIRHTLCILPRDLRAFLNAIGNRDMAQA